MYLFIFMWGGVLHLNLNSVSGIFLVNCIEMTTNYGLFVFVNQLVVSAKTNTVLQQAKTLATELTVSATC